MESAREATSSGLPILPAGISSIMFCLSSSLKQRFMSVSMTPQAMAFTFMPEGASSFARAFVKAFIPPFVAEYATSHEAPHTPQTELMFIIEPLWFLIMSGMASLQVENTDERLVFTILFQSSMLISCKSPMCEIPALFMSTSMLPKRSDILSNSAFTSSYFPTSHVTARQSAPSRRISSAVFSKVREFLPHITRLYCFSAYASASA